MAMSSPGLSITENHSGWRFSQEGSAAIRDNSRPQGFEEEARSSAASPSFRLTNEGSNVNLSPADFKSANTGKVANK
jgi:hypothetical protein